MSDEWEPKIVVFLCQWSGFCAESQYPLNVRIIQLPCAGRLNPLYVMKAFQSGFDGVFVVGCHAGNCHYVSGSDYVRRRLVLLKSLLSYVGVEEERLQDFWVSPIEENRFSQVIAEAADTVKKLGPLRKLVKKWS